MCDKTFEFKLNNIQLKTNYRDKIVSQVLDELGIELTGELSSKITMSQEF